MRRLLYGNFDYEYELGQPGHIPSVRLRQLNAELTPHLLALANGDDTLLLPEPLPSGFGESAVRIGLSRPAGVHIPSDAGIPPFIQPTGNGGNSDLIEGMTPEPWGWSHSSIELLRSLGATGGNTKPAAFRSANSRAFAAAVEAEFGLHPDGASEIESRQSLGSRLREVAALWQSKPESFRWILKAEFGMSGRDRLVGRGISLEDNQVNWIERRLRSGQRLFLEPFLDCVCEFSTQWHIGTITEYDPSPLEDSACNNRLIGMTLLHSDERGQFRACEPCSNIETAASATDIDARIFQQGVQSARLAVDRIADLGCIGACGIDAMIYRGVAGDLQLRPLQDVNVRWTMGRIAWELSRRCTPNDKSRRVLWSLVSTSALCNVLELQSPQSVSRFHEEHELDLSEFLRSRRLIADNVECLLTSPLTIGNRPTSRTGILVTGPDARLTQQTLDLFS